MHGKVKWFNRQAGYGYITGGNGKDYFIHYTNIKAEGFKDLNRGDSVMFNDSRNPKGEIAINVIRLECAKVKDWRSVVRE